jgi:hypothetical protein
MFMMKVGEERPLSSRALRKVLYISRPLCIKLSLILLCVSYGFEKRSLISEKSVTGSFRKQYTHEGILN